MKTKINIFVSKLPVKIFAILLLLVVASCGEDFLDLQNQNQITADKFYQTPQDFHLAVNTLYRRANTIKDVFLQNSRGDDMVLTDGAFENQINFASFLNSATSGDSDGLYSGLYNLIYRANNILFYIENDNVDWTGYEDQKSTLTAEAYFFRGLAYFYLAHSFGWVPIVTAPAQSEEEFSPAKAETIGEVYDQAIADLKLAKAGLPEEPADPGRVTIGSATGFLGKTYLYRASYLDENEYYALAATEFEELMDMGYGLVDDYEDNFTFKNENNQESLFELQYLFNPSLRTPTQDRIFNSVPGIGYEIYLRPSEWCLNEMGMEKTIDGLYDQRFIQTAYFNGDSCFGVPYNQLGDGLYVEGGVMVGGAPDGSSSTEGGWWKKYLNVHLPYETNPGEGDNNERVLRYADILLMYAEAKVMSGPSLTEAIAAVKEVRDRANLPEKTYTNAEDLMAEIRHQRVMELTYENYHYFDLIRWGLMGEAFQDHGTDAQKLNYDPVKHKYFPLPLSEIINNKNLEQNEAWQ